MPNLGAMRRKMEAAAADAARKEARKTSQEPSFEDILASIRRIMSEEDVDLELDKPSPSDALDWVLPPVPDDADGSAGVVRESTRVLNQDEIDSLLGYDEEKAMRPLTATETPAAWSFKSDAVAKKFEDHVREQLPWYDALSLFVADVAVSFLPTGGVLYDIGASTGNITRLLAADIEAKKARAISVEPSHQMAKEWHGAGDLVVIDAERINYSKDRPDVAVMFLMLMFMRPAEREAFLRGICRAITPGGALILVDKGYLGVPYAQVACKAAQLAGKRRDGTPADAYVTKELALRGEQRPTDQRAVFEIAGDEGFVVEEIFRFGEFYGVLAVKSSL